jgi:hypothetical protein
MLSNLVFALAGCNIRAMVGILWKARSENLSNGINIFF